MVALMAKSNVLSTLCTQALLVALLAKSCCSPVFVHRYNGGSPGQEYCASTLCTQALTVVFRPRVCTFHTLHIGSTAAFLAKSFVLTALCPWH